MTEFRAVKLQSADQAKRAFRACYDQALFLISQGIRPWLRLDEDTRSEEQSRKFHAICSDLEASPVEFMRKRRTKDEWKLLMVSAHAIVSGEKQEICGGLEGELVVLRERTSKMTVERMSSLIEYALAFCATHEVSMRNYERVSQ